MNYTDKLVEVLTNKWTPLALGLVGICTLLLTYSNHFDNGFRFDDGHTIVHNEYIRDIGNIPLFFKDISTFGTMPNNRGYRPVVTTLNAIDYWRGRENSPGKEKGQLIPRNFHTSIMFWYVLQCILMYFLFKYIMDQSLPSKWNGLVAAVGVAYYAHHTTNAETINYIISRSDSFSTLCIVASMVLFINKLGRKYFLYLLPMIVGIFTKETGVMFVPILFFFILLFEEELSLVDLFRLKKQKLGKIKKAFIKAIPSVVVGLSSFYFCRMVMTPAVKMMRHTGTSRIEYFYTQANVIAHYLGNFILPLNLSADPDFGLIRTIWDGRVIFGLSILLGFFVIALYTSKKKETLPISFGLLWFYLALAPTSSFHPLGQIANDHRTFFPFIGLVLSVTWTIYLLLRKYKDLIVTNIKYPLTIGLVIFMVIGGYAYGTYQRNKVWSSSESLWRDVSIKSPKNGRGLMNFGLTLMSKGKYDQAEDYFTRAIELLPYYSYLHINMGVLKNAQGKVKEAETFYQSAIKYDRSNAEAYHYYARFLFNEGRKDEAIEYARQGHELSPGHARLRAFYEALLNNTIQPKKKKAKQGKGNAGNISSNDYINLSLKLFNQGEYENCINACRKALEIDPESAKAYNNMCIAFIRLGRLDQAIQAGQKALELEPDFNLARNNLRWAKSLKSKAIKK